MLGASSSNMETFVFFSVFLFVFVVVFLAVFAATGPPPTEDKLNTGIKQALLQILLHIPK